MAESEISDAHDRSAYAQRIVSILEPALGKHTARRALSIVCKKLDREPAGLTRADHQAACDALRPMLRTLLGRSKTDMILTGIGVG